MSSGIGRTVPCPAAGGAGANGHSEPDGKACGGAVAPAATGRQRVPVRR